MLKPNVDRGGGQVWTSQWSTNPCRQLDRLLDASLGPQTVEQLARRLGLSPRFVGYMIAERIRKGTVQLSPGGAFVRAVQNQPRADRGLALLLESVRGCEAEWELDRRLGLL